MSEVFTGIPVIDRFATMANRAIESNFASRNELVFVDPKGQPTQRQKNLQQQRRETIRSWIVALRILRKSDDQEHLSLAGAIIGDRVVH